MKTLLLYGKFIQSFSSGYRVKDNPDARELIPPLGLITLEGLLPDHWPKRFFDRNITPEVQTDWQWCDLVVIAAMGRQKKDFCVLIKKALQLGKKVAVCGPYPSSVPQESLISGAHYLILDNEEATVPLFLKAIEMGESQGIFRSVEQSPTNMRAISSASWLSLTQRNAYFMKAVEYTIVYDLMQFSELKFDKTRAIAFAQDLAHTIICGDYLSNALGILVGAEFHQSLHQIKELLLNFRHNQLESKISWSEQYLAWIENLRKAIVNYHHNHQPRHFTTLNPQQEEVLEHYYNTNQRFMNWLEKEGVSAART